MNSIGNVTAPAPEKAAAEPKPGGAIRRRRFTVPYDCFWIAAIGLALEGCAGEFIRFFEAPTAAAGNDLMVLYRAFTIVALFVCIALAARQRRTFLFDNRSFAIVTGIVFALGLGMYYQEQLFVGHAPGTEALGFALTTVAGYIFLLIWFDRIMVYGIRNVLITVAVALMLRSVFQLLIIALQKGPGTLVLALLPLASLPFLMQVFTASENHALEATGPQRSTSPFPTLRNDRIVLAAIFVALLFIPLLVSLNVFQTEGGGESGGYLPLRQVGCLVANLATGLVLFGFSYLQHTRKTVFIFFSVMVALACLGAFGVMAGLSSSIMFTIGSCTRKCLDFAVLFPAYLFCKQGTVDYRRFLLARACTATGSFVAGVINLLPTLSEIVPTAMALCLIGLFAALITLFIFGDAPDSLAPSAAAEAPEQVIRSPFRDALDQIAAEANLTATEGTILGLIARGHNAESVRKTLLVSVNTAKTHIRNIYAKLGVHSQQELIALVEATKREVLESYNRPE
ncbi:response regulator transcription factor [Parvibacter caecicola]|uniref:DNA-binding CsgD family transcriptional regulator n=1 Tax=Parvibacter caecicola TaxID=747645 RepID=A0A3N0ACI9_9ACTN|nr:helix-turn-helix transcriptional regulator [Parvibacter caecicola]MBB3171990.1 DNA-binding CsgD family transcriptional regulator [Parvibacter caecicola]MCR2041073.1 helix-turn-helix transcriptional regulator [Parvibacter caecicola]RNL11723.1 hypothetical protein DMP11_03010 [Parvibacter caecicola]TJW10673.1 LuxR family transcriptional regulator [Parvibacter caecicola]